VRSPGCRVRDTGATGDVMPRIDDAPCTCWSRCARKVHRVRAPPPGVFETSQDREAQDGKPPNPTPSDGHHRLLVADTPEAHFGTRTIAESLGDRLGKFVARI
jgi:hypothetical protein